jgi:hypothetical protein
MDLVVVLAVGLVVMVMAAVAVGLQLYSTRRRLERERDAVAQNAGVTPDSERFSRLTRVEQEILLSEVLWKDEAGHLRDRLFRSLDKLTTQVEDFNRALSAIPTLIDQRIPRAVNAVGDGLEISSKAFDDAGRQFSLAAQRVSEFGASYAIRMEGLLVADKVVHQQQLSFDKKMAELREQRLAMDQQSWREADAAFKDRQSSFDNRWATLLEERLTAEKEAIAAIRARSAQLEGGLDTITSQRIEAERVLIDALKEKTNALKTGRISIG